MWVLWAVLAIVVGFAGWVRLAPLNSEVWHVDPMVAESPGSRGWLVRPEAGDAAWPVWALPPEDVLGTLDKVALGEPRTRRIAGDVGAGRITYVTRSRLWGFPDYTTVQVIPGAAGATLALHARARFGQSDVGVNRARVERWRDALGQALPAPEAG